MKSLRQTDLLILLSLFVLSIHTIKLRGDKPIKYTQANCELYTEVKKVPIEDIVHPQFSVDKTREELIDWLINANPDVDKSQLNELIDKLVEEGTTKLLPDNTHFIPIKKPEDLPGDLLDIDDILADSKKKDSTGPNPPNNNASNNSSSAPSNLPSDNSSSNPPSNLPSDNSSSNPPSNLPSDNSSSNPPSNLPSDNSSSNPPSNLPSDNSSSNPPSNLPPTTSSSDSTTNNSTSNPPPSNPTSNNSSTPQERAAITPTLPQILKDAYNTATQEFITSNNINPNNVLPLPIDNPLKPKPASSSSPNNNSTNSSSPSSSSSNNNTTPPSPPSNNSSSSASETSSPNTSSNSIEAINQLQETFNSDRDGRGWLYQGPLGVTFTSEGIIRCGNSLIALYFIVSPGTVYNTTNFPVDLTGDALALWVSNSDSIQCYSNYVTVPFSIVAEENEVIEESNKNRICFYGRVINSNENAILIRTRYYELVQGNTMGCDGDTWAPLMNDTFKLLDNSNPGMNHCYCGVEGQSS